MKYFKRISFRKKLLVILLPLFLNACSAKISNFPLYQKQILGKTSFMPDKDLSEGRPAKVVVFAFDEGENKIALQSQLGKVMTLEVENILIENKLARLVDRKIAKKLQQEIILSEMYQGGVYKGPEVANYAILGEIGNASFASKYSSGMPMPRPDGTFSPPQPKFTYSSQVSGNVKIYEIPSMKVVENFDFSGKESRSENVKTDNNISIGGLITFGGQKSEGLKRDDGLVRNAGAEAVDSILFDLKNFFAKKGFILERRDFKDKVIFKISVGSADGIKKSDRFEIIGSYSNNNDLTGKTDIEHRVIATGRVSGQINSKSSWVVLDNKESIPLIRLGDKIKFKYKRGFLGKSMKLIKNII